jgi:hypothetical protein
MKTITCEHTGEEINSDDVRSVATWTGVSLQEARRIILFGLARGMGHAATDADLARKIRKEYEQ